MTSQHYFVRVASRLMLMVAVLVAGCTGAAKTPESNLQAAAAQLKSTLDASSKDITHLRREQVAYSWSTQASLTDDNFVDFVCAGAGAFAVQQAAVGTIQQLATTVDALTAPPGSDLSTVLASIAKYHGKVEPLKSQGNKEEDPEKKAVDECRTQSLSDLEGIRGPAAKGRFAILALPAVFAAVQALADATQKLILLAAQQADAAQRARQFQTFMDEQSTRGAMQAILGPCALHRPSDPNSQGPDFDDIGQYPIDRFDDTVAKCMDKLGPAARVFGLSDSKMQSIIDERRRLSLLAPYNQFKAIAIASEANGSHAKYLATIDKVDQSLATFDSLRTQRIAKDQHRKIVLAVDNLWRVSQGRLNAQEGAQALWAAAQNLSALLSAAGSDIGAIQDKYKGLTDALQKL